MYLRKWTRMRWSDRLSRLYELGIKTNSEEYPVIQRFSPSVHISGAIPKKHATHNEDRELINTLLERYPDLKYANTSYGRSQTDSTEGNYILDFIKYQKSLLRKGYTKEKSFEITEKKFHDKFSKKMEEAVIAHNLAYDNNARSMLSIAEQISEAEARFKVARVTRDLFLYTEAKKKFEKTLKDLEKESSEKNEEAEEEEGEEITEDPSAQQDPILNFEKRYTRVLYKIVPKKGSTIEDPKTAGERKQVINEFIKNTRNMFNLYYERASALDRLSGLTDNEIMNVVAPTPSQLKRQTKDLLKKLIKYNIKLDSNGEVDYSGCPYPHVVKKLKENPMVKIALLQNDLEYELPHREVQMDLAKRIKQDYEEYQREAERLRKSSEKTEETDTAINADDSPFHKQYNISYPKAEVYKPKEEKTGIPRQDLGDMDLLSPEATYRVFESYEERIARLEKKWLQSRLAAIESGPEKPTSQEQMALINQAVEKLRRVKFLVDQKNLENAKDLIFEEHKVFTKEEMLVDNEVQAEKLIHYLKYPEEKRRLTARDELDDDKMLRMIARKEIIEDTVKPFEDYYNHRLEESDTKEYRDIRMKQRKLEAEKKKAAQAREAKEAQDEEQDRQISQEEKEETKDSKSEKKKLVEYIKQSADKGAKKAAKKK